MSAYIKESINDIWVKDDRLRPSNRLLRARFETFRPTNERNGNFDQGVSDGFSKESNRNKWVD